MNTHPAPSSTPSAMFRSLWRNRQLIWQMTRREIAARYRGSMIGLAWLFINPLLMLLVYTFVFSVVFKARWGIEEESKTDFAIILFTGVIIFGLFFGHFAEIVSYAPKLFIYKTNSVPIGFSEVMGLTDSQSNTTCRLHWYNNVVLDTQLWFGNVSSSTATVNV